MQFKKILAFSIGPVGAALISFFTLPLLAWEYSPEDIGRLAMINTIASLAILVFSLGLDQAFVREYHETKLKERLFLFSFTPGFIILFITLALLLFYEPTFLSEVVFGILDENLSIYFAIYILFLFITRFFALIYRMMEKGITFSFFQMLPKLLIFLGVFFIVIFGEHKYNIQTVIQWYSLSIFIAGLIIVYVTKSFWLVAAKYSFDLKKMKELLLFGTPLILSGVAFWGLTALDKVFLRALSSFHELGVYSVSVSFAGVAIIIQSVFSTIWAPTVYKWAREKINIDRIIDITDSLLAVVAFLFCIIGLFSWLISYILPKNYQEVVYILVACMVYPLFYTLSECTVVGIGIKKKTFYALFASLIALLVNICGNYLLVPTFGAKGAAVSTAISFFVFLVFRTEFSRFLWCKFPRIKLYLICLYCLFLSTMFTFYGSSNHILFTILWLFTLLYFIFIWKNKISLTFSLLQKYFYIKS